jgi:hypothetical protein
MSSPSLRFAKLLHSFSRPRLVVFGSVCGTQDLNGGNMFHLIWYINCSFDRRGSCQIRHAYVPDTTLDDSARDRRFTCGRMCHSHVFAPEGRCSVSSGRSYLFHTWSPSRFVCLAQAEAAPSCWIAYRGRPRIKVDHSPRTKGFEHRHFR